MVEELSVLLNSAEEEILIVGDILSCCIEDVGKMESSRHEVEIWSLSPARARTNETFCRVFSCDRPEHAGEIKYKVHKLPWVEEKQTQRQVY
jgi:hypothetical protein